MLTYNHHFYAEPTQHGRFLVQDKELHTDFSQASVENSLRDHGSKAIAFSQSSMHDSMY